VKGPPELEPDGAGPRRFPIAEVVVLAWIAVASLVSFACAVWRLCVAAAAMIVRSAERLGGGL
jgi:hypothetical protein